MAVGQTYAVQSGTAQQYFIPSGFNVPTVGVLNPNDGITYVARNRQASNTSVGSWDYKVPSQSYAILPGGLWQSVGIFYIDQSGSNNAGEVTVYPLETQYSVPVFQAIGRAQQTAGTAVDITQGSQPANPPANTGRLWIDGAGNLNVLNSTGANRTEIDNVNAPTYINPLISAFALGGDLYGTVANGHVWAHTNPVQLDRGINVQWGANTSEDRIVVWSDANMYFDSATGAYLFRQGGTTFVQFNYGSNIVITQGSNAGTYAPTSLTWNGDTIIERWNANQVRFPSGSGITCNGNITLENPTNAYIWSQSGQGFTNPSNSYINLNAPLAFDNAANSPGARLAFNQNIGNKITFYDTGSANCYGIGVQSNYLEFYTGGTNFGFKPNSTGGTLWFSIFSGGVGVQAGGQYNWANGPYILNSGNDLLFRSLGSGYHYFQNTGGAGGQVVCGGMTANSGAVDVNQWVRSQSGTFYLTTSGDRITDGGDNNNWVFYGPLGSVNFVFQHRDSSWMGTQAANFQTMSDWRLKMNVTPITDIECMARLRTPSIPVVVWDTQNAMALSPSPQDIGFIAQDMATAVPEVVSVDNDGNHFLSYGNLTAVLWGALRNLDSRVSALGG